MLWSIPIGTMQRLEEKSHGFISISTTHTHTHQYTHATCHMDTKTHIHTLCCCTLLLILGPDSLAIPHCSVLPAAQESVLNTQLWLALREGATDSLAQPVLVTTGDFHPSWLYLFISRTDSQGSKTPAPVRSLLPSIFFFLCSSSLLSLSPSLSKAVSSSWLFFSSLKHTPSHTSRYAHLRALA